MTKSGYYSIINKQKENIINLDEVQEMTEICEIMMIVLFGMSWPMNVIKAYKVRTTKGKSLIFLLLVFIGYIFGITGKLLSDSFKWYVLFFYILNFIMVGLDLLLYIRNRRLDKMAEKEA